MIRLALIFGPCSPTPSTSLWVLALLAEAVVVLFVLRPTYASGHTRASARSVRLTALAVAILGAVILVDLALISPVDCNVPV